VKRHKRSKLQVNPRYYLGVVFCIYKGDGLAVFFNGTSETIDGRTPWKKVIYEQTTKSRLRRKSIDNIVNEGKVMAGTTPLASYQLRPVQ
jgi:hypothetical protein